MLVASPARAHEDPAGCFETGPAIIVSVFRANGTTGVVGTVSECETINYRATLQKAADNDTICAFSGGTFKLTTPDGVVHDINLNVPCIGGNGPGEGCDPTVDNVVSSLIPYTVDPSDVSGGLIVATAVYTGGVAHDSPLNTAGVGANTPKSTPVTICADNNPCTIDACDPNVAGSAACSNTPINCNDNDPCTSDSCVSGSCVNAPGALNCNDNDPCTTDACVTGVGCTNTPGALNCNDNDVCTSDQCVTGVGCVNTPGALNCNDNDICTDDSCDPQAGCVNVFDETNDESCRNDAICRTPGFWKTHGAVSDQVIDAAGGCLEVCGEVITTAAANSVGNADSVLEAMCISPRGESKLQLVRQLTALALNCVISEFGPNCGDDPGLGDLFNDCTNACINNTADVGDCISAIDCFNNGGIFNGETGLCGDDPGESCHDRALPDSINQTSADTPQACNAASKSPCTAVPTAAAETDENLCTSGVRSAGPEVCL